MQWNTLPAKPQRELFDNAGSMGDILNTSALRAGFESQEVRAIRRTSNMTDAA
jgi:hypothetical protein